MTATIRSKSVDIASRLSILSLFPRTAILCVTLLTCCLSISDAFAAVTATGDFSPDPIVPDTALDIGANAYGMLRIDDGTNFVSDHFQIGGNNSGFGVVTVTDAGTVWTSTGGTVGGQGFGQLNVLDGAVAQVLNANEFQLANSYGGYGHVVVAGPGSLLHVNSYVRVGYSGGSGVVEIRDGGIFNAPAQNTQIGLGGRVALAGGLLRTRQLGNEGLIGGSGEINLTDGGSFYNQGRIEVRNGESLRISASGFGGLNNEGEVLVDAGELEVPYGISNDNFGQFSATIKLRNAEFRSGISSGDNEGHWTNRGIVNIFGGENHLHGNLRNESNGRIAITNESSVLFHDSVEQYSNSLISVSPGSEALFLKGLNMNGGTLLADIAGYDDFGHVEIIGFSQLFGSVRINLTDGFQPKAGDSFQLVSHTGQANGFLYLDQPPQLPGGLEWKLEMGTHSVVLNVVAPLEGDYNEDGVVDAADYTVWRNWNGSVYAPADGDHSGVVDAGDYSVWKANYGRTFGSGSGGISSSVPEPASWIGLLAALAAIVPCRPRFVFAC